MNHGGAKPHINIAASIVVAALLGACGDKPAPGSARKQPSVIEPQLRALERARGVEQTVQQGADDRRKATDEAGK